MLGFSSLGSTALASVSVIDGAVVIVIPPTPVAIGRPVSDRTNDGWLPSSGTDLFSLINETSQDDATHIFATRKGAVYRGNFPPMTVPGDLLRYTGGTDFDNGIIVRLYAGGQVVGTWAHMLAPIVVGQLDTMYERHLSPAQTAMLAAGDLSYEFTLT